MASARDATTRRQRNWGVVGGGLFLAVFGSWNGTKAAEKEEMEYRECFFDEYRPVKFLINPG